MKEKLLESFANLANSVIAAAPKVVVGILLIIAGLVVAKLVEAGLRMVLVRVHFDSLVEKAGVDKMLQRVGLRQHLNLFLPRIVYFLVIFLLAKTASDALGLVAISNAIGGFFSYLPNIIAALLLLILGTSLGQFAGQTVAQAAESSGIDFAGKRLEIGGERGVLNAITATHAILETDGQDISVANSTFLDQVSKQ